MNYVKQHWVGIVWVAAIGWATGLAPSSGFAATDRYVSPGGNNIPPYTNWNDAATSIKDAVDVANAANAGDTVWVTNDTYTLTAEVAILNTIVRSVNGREVTFVNGNYPNTSHRCFYLNHSNAVLRGFTATNGNAATGNTGGGDVRYGGGAYIGAGTIQECTIRSNRAASGGGVYMVAGTVSDSTIEYNTGYSFYGGGVYAVGDSLIERCVVRHNTVTLGAGGIFLNNGAMAQYCRIEHNVVPATGSTTSGGGFYISTDGGTVRHCLVVSNSVGLRGGGGALAGVNALLENSIIQGNTVQDTTGTRLGGGVYMINGEVRNSLIVENYSTLRGGGLHGGAGTALRNSTVAANVSDGGGGGLSIAAATMTIENTIIYFNTNSTGSTEMNIRSVSMGAYTNSCSIESPSITNYGSGNITVDPLFINPGEGNYQLQRESLCVDVGTNRLWMEGATDLAGKSRISPFTGIVDIGAYEHHLPGTMISIR